MSWYRDKAVDNIDPAVVRGASGGAARALAKIARIPLDMETRDMAHRKLAVDEQANLVKRYVADQRVKGQSIAASGKIAAAQLGLQGKEAAAFARKYDADIGRENNIRTNNTAHDKMEYGVIQETMKGANQRDVAKLNGKNQRIVAKLKMKAKSPTETVYKYDADGNRIAEIRKPYVAPVDFSLDAMEKIAKRTKQKGRRR